MTLGKTPAARFEISIDGVPRTYRNEKDFPLLAAKILKNQKSQQCRQAEKLEDRDRDRHRVQGGTIITECSPDWLKFKNPDAPAVKREAEEEWAK